jgi:hypothetical protein
VATTDTWTAKAVAVSKVELANDWTLALIAVPPSVRVVARPVALMFATVAFDEVHVAKLVTSCVLPLL